MTEKTSRTTDSREQDLSFISKADFLNMGVGRVGYVRPITPEGKANLAEAKANISAYAAFAANGVEIGIFPTRAEALRSLWSLEMEAITLH